MRNKYVACGIMLSTIFLFTGCTEKNMELETNSNNGLQLGQSVTEAATEKISATDSTTASIRRKLPLNESVVKKADIYQPDESFEIDGLGFSNIQCTVSKSLLYNLDQSDIDYWSDEVADEDGTLMDCNTYVYINLTITNNNDTDEIFYLSAGSLVELDESGRVTDSSVELRYRSGLTLTPEERKSYKGYYKTTLYAGQSEDFVLGFIIHEEFANGEHLYYMVNKTGDTREQNLKTFQLR